MSRIDQKRKDKAILNSNLGNVIRNTRNSHDIKQKELAEAVGVSANYLSMLERGDRNPSLDVLIKIAKQLDTSLHELFLRAEAPELNSDYKRGYYLAKLLDKVDFDTLSESAEALVEELSENGDGDYNDIGNEEKVTG